MEPVFGRRQNLVAIVIGAAVFFTALGFFLATNVQTPRDSQAQDLWVEGNGLSDSQRNVASFTPIVEEMKGSVVRVEVVGGASTTDTTTQDQAPDETPPSTAPGDQQTTTTTTLDQLPPDHPPLPEGFEQTSEGSGVVISKDGYILTNQHVVEGAQSVTVFFQADEEAFDAKVVGSDSRDDLALLKIEPKADLRVAPLGDSDKMKVGDWVLAMGNPLGFEYSATVGVVSGVSRRLPSSNFGDFLQTDAAIYPGNSGGPLFNLAGEVIAINTAVIPDTNLGFAVPINTAKEILPQLQSTGSVTRGYLGVSIQAVGDVPNPPAGVKEGAVVMEVHPGGPAAEAGIKEGDVIVAFDDTPVADPDELTALVTQVKPGTRVTVDVVRDGERTQIEVVIGSLPSELE